jgi:hypothetical protein
VHAVGWRDRDWAKFNDDEWEAIYGFRRGPRPRPAAHDGPAAPPRGDRVRRSIWGGVAVAVLAVFGFAFATRPPVAHTHIGIAPAPSTLYGIPGSGTENVCTEMVAAVGSTQWHCLAWTINLQHLPVVEPYRYPGACVHAIVDQTRGAWTCLNGGAPMPSEPVQPSAPPA